MDTYQSVHITFIPRSNLQLNPTNDEQQNMNICSLSCSNQNITLNHSIIPQPLSSKSSRLINNQSYSKTSNDNNISPQNNLTNSSTTIFIIYFGIIMTVLVLISLSIGIYGLIYINRTTTTITTTTTTTAPSIVAITQAGDLIVGICNTIAGGSTGGSAVNYPVNQNPPNAIDNTLSTKYLNFGDSSSGCSGSSAPGIDTGFYVTPNISDISIAVGLLFATADDSPNRDPITVTLEGTNATSTVALDSGSSWTLIYSGPTGISSSIDPGRLVYVPQQNFSNTIAFSSYRLLVTSKRGTDNSVQYGEAHIIGYFSNS